MSSQYNKYKELIADIERKISKYIVSRRTPEQQNQALRIKLSNTIELLQQQESDLIERLAIVSKMLILYRESFDALSLIEENID